MRNWPIPSGSQTVHFLGDAHLGAPYEPLPRLEKIKKDLETGDVPAPAHRIQIGDFSDSAARAGDAQAIAYMESLKAVDGAAWHALAGNHDLIETALHEPSRTLAEWATATGQPARLSQDLGFVLLLGISPESGTKLTYAAADLAWLEEQLAKATKNCWVLSHYPLENTVIGPKVEATNYLGPEYLVFDSTEAAFRAIGPNGTNDSQIRAVLASSANAKAYICGHTHTPPACSGQVQTLSLGGHNVAHINVASPAYIGRSVITSGQSTPVWTAYVTAASGPNRIEVRFRNHGLRSWDGVAPGERVAVVTL